MKIGSDFVKLCTKIKLKNAGIELKIFRAICQIIDVLGQKTYPIGTSCSESNEKRVYN